jgi:aspartate-semialdehyde dehydrogenase
MKVLECKPDVGGFKDCGVVFSGLDQDVAGDIGKSLPSFSHRMGASK